MTAATRNTIPPWLADAYTEHHDRIRRYLHSRTRNHAAAEDLTHDVFVRAAVKAHQFDGRNVGGWLTTMAVNIAVDYARSARQRREWVTDEFHRGGDEGGHPDGVGLRVDVDSDPVVHVLARERDERRCREFEEVRAAMAVLSNPQRRCIELDLAGCDVVLECAELGGISRKALTQLRVRARARLRASVASAGTPLS